MTTAVAQGQQWSQAAHDWAELEEPTGRPLWDVMLDAVGTGPQTRLLDVGCGAGSACAYAAARGAQVNGVDAAASLIMIARQRVPDAHFQIGDVAALPYLDRAFDAIIVANVLQYTPEPLPVLREVRRVCAPGGRVAVAVWADSATCDLHAVWVEVGRSFSLAVDDPFKLSPAGVLESLLQAAGLRPYQEDLVVCTGVYLDRETAGQAQLSHGMLQALRRVAGTQQLRDTVIRALGGFESRSGEVTLRNQVRVIVAMCDS